MRKLKRHEKILVKKANFLEWKREGGHRENEIMYRFLIRDRDDYKKHQGLCRMVEKLTNIMKQMDPSDPFRIQMTDVLLEKLFSELRAIRFCLCKGKDITWVFYRLGKAWL